MRDLRRTVLALVDVVKMLPHALARLEEATPGWPSTASGRGTGTSSSAGGSFTSQTERAWPTLANDPVLADKARLERLAAEIEHEVNAFHDLVARWAAPKAGVPGPEDNDEWCRSCRRIGVASPAERAGLCAWCRKFRYTEGDLPPVELLEARRDGKRITARMVAEAKGRKV